MCGAIWSLSVAGGSKIGNDPPIFDILTICGRHALADAPVKEKQVKLQVANARAEESGGGIARIPRSAMAGLGLTEGDVVQIHGKRQTPARILRTAWTSAVKGKRGTRR